MYLNSINKGVGYRIDTIASLFIRQRGTGTTSEAWKKERQTLITDSLTVNKCFCSRLAILELIQYCEIPANELRIGTGNPEDISILYVPSQRVSTLLQDICFTTFQNGQNSWMEGLTKVEQWLEELALLACTKNFAYPLDPYRFCLQ